MASEQDEIQAARKDPRHFAVLYERYFTTIFRFILRRTQDRELTADLAQQTFLKAMLGLHRYEPRGLPFRAWLYRIALNELRMFWRKRREVCIDLAHGEARLLSEEMGMEDDDGTLRRLAACLGRLDQDRARLIELRYMDGLSFAELGPQRPLYRDPKAFLVLLVIVLLAWLLSGDHRRAGQRDPAGQDGGVQKVP